MNPFLSWHRPFSVAFFSFFLFCVYNWGQPCVCSIGLDFSFIIVFFFFSGVLYTYIYTVSAGGPRDNAAYPAGGQ